MILLKTLGTPALQRDDGLPAAAATQRRPFALLALLAVAGERGASREKLIAYLWPERGEERARHVMAQTLYALRRDLPGAEVVLGTSELRLNPDAIRSDVADFEAAAAAGDAERAAALYGGPFLDGFHVSEAPEFERWAGSERTRLSARARLVFERAARTAATELDAHRAVEWWRRVVAIDPVDATAAVGLMEALAAIGDRSGALRHARVYEALVREELSVPPDAAVCGLVERLRANGGEASASFERGRDREHSAARERAEGSGPQARAQPEPLLAALPARAGDSVEKVLHPDPSRGAGDVGPVAAPRGRRGQGWSLRTLLPGAVLVLALAALGARAILASRPDAAPTAVFAVGAVRDYRGSDSSGIARALADMLATNLARVPDVRLVSNARIYEILGREKPGGDLAAQLNRAARQAGAVEVVEGALFRQASGLLRFDVRRVDIASGAIRKAYSVEGLDPFELVDRATAEFATDVSPGSSADFRIADVTTRSLVAYRFYEQGLHAYYQQDDLAAARRLFLAALAEDADFAMAQYYAALCENLLGIPTSADRFAQAVRLAERATDRERLLIQAVASGFHGNDPSHFAAARELATRYPDEPDGHYLYGGAVVWRGDFLAGVPHLWRVIEMDSASLRGASTGCRACDAFSALVNAYWLADSMAAAERTAREWIRLQPGSHRAWSTLAGMLLFQGREEPAREAMRMSVRLHGSEPDWRMDVLMAVRAGDFAAADSSLARAERENRVGEVPWFRALSLRYQGRLREALDVTRHVPPDGPDWTAPPANGLAEAIVLFEIGRFRDAATRFNAIAATPNHPLELRGRNARERAWNLTHAATALAAAGDTAAVARLADSVQHVGALSAYGRDQRLHHYVRGLLLRARGQLPEAAEEFRRGIFSLTDGYTRNSYELARTLLALGRPEEAIAVLRPAFHGSIQGSNTYLTHTELHEAIAQAFEDAAQPDSAAVHYAYVVRAWSAADEPFRARWERARARLAALNSTD